MTHRKWFADTYSISGASLEFERVGAQFLWNLLISQIIVPQGYLNVHFSSKVWLTLGLCIFDLIFSFTSYICNALLNNWLLLWFQAVAVTSLAFPTGDVNNFIVGSEEGTVYTACRHGSRAGILDSFEGMIP